MTCTHGVWEVACAICKPVHSSRDQAWHFRHPTLGYISSKGEFDRRCKAKGLVRVSTDELVTRGEPTKPGAVKVNPRMIGNLVQEFMAKSRNPDLVAAQAQRVAERVKTPLSPVGVDYATPER